LFILEKATLEKAEHGTIIIYYIKMFKSFDCLTATKCSNRVVNPLTLIWVSSSFFLLTSNSFLSRSIFVRYLATSNNFRLKNDFENRIYIYIYHKLRLIVKRNIVIVKYTRIRFSIFCIVRPIFLWLPVLLRCFRFGSTIYIHIHLFDLYVYIYIYITYLQGRNLTLILFDFFRSGSTWLLTLQFCYSSFLIFDSE